MDAQGIPQELVDIVDRDAGKQHSRSGSVLASLARVLTRYDEMRSGVRVGVAVLCWRGGQFLMQQRRGGRGEGCWSVPGGQIEHGETWQHAAIREVREETGLDVFTPRLLTVTSDISGREHWVTIWGASVSPWGQPEPSDECAAYQWVPPDPEALPRPLWQPYWDNFLAEGFPK